MLLDLSFQPKAEGSWRKNTFSKQYKKENDTLFNLSLKHLVQIKMKRIRITNAFNFSSKNPNKWGGRVGVGTGPGRISVLNSTVSKWKGKVLFELFHLGDNKENFFWRTAGQVLLYVKCISSKTHLFQAQYDLARGAEISPFKQ